MMLPGQQFLPGKIGGAPPPMNGLMAPMPASPPQGAGFPEGFLGPTVTSRASSSATSLLEGSPLLRTNGSSPLKDWEATIENMLTGTDTMLSERDIMEFHDALYKRCAHKYGNDPEVKKVFADAAMNENQQQLLQVIRVGNVEKIDSFIGLQKAKKELHFSWEFVYPPVKVVPGRDGISRRVGPDGWCRSPLCLLVCPDDNILEPMLPNVDSARRWQLIRSALRAGADPNFPPTYWATPAVLACMAGDLEVLKLLVDWGCNLSQKVEFGTQSGPEFTLVHAAAVNGHLHILKYLQEKLPAEVFTAKDAESSNALHVLMRHSKDLESAKFLLDHGCDGFDFNVRQESPLSLAIEFSPEFAKELLSRKSRAENPWMGKEMYSFCFRGIVLPLTPEGAPLQARSSSGDLMAVEEMMVAFQAKDLMTTPLMQDLISMKWLFFGKMDYMKRVGPYILFVLSMLVLTTADPHGQLFRISVVSASPLVFYEVYCLVGHKGRRDFWHKMDSCNIAMAILAIVYKLLHTVNVGLPHDNEWLRPVYAIVSMSLQLTMTVRALRLIVVDSHVGPLLIAVAQMAKDTAPWLVLTTVTVFGFTNAFFALAHSDPNKDVSQDSDFDWSYGSILKALLLAASSMDAGDFMKMPDDLSEESFGVRGGAWFLFWLFAAIAILMLLNLLIAVYNTAYVTIVEGNSAAEWAFLRLQLLLYAEHGDRADAGVQAYYQELSKFDGRRTFAKSIDVAK